MTILETISILEQPGTYFNLLGFSLMTLILGLVITASLLLKDCFISGSIFMGISAIGAITFIISVILTITEPAIDTGRVKYTIRLDDTVSVNEFYDKYKVLEHTKYTDVYTVEEIND